MYYTVQLDPIVWEDLCQKIRVRPEIPSWVGEVCAKQFGEVEKWPTILRNHGVARPELSGSEKTSYLNFAQSTAFSALKGNMAENHQRRVQAIKGFSGDKFLVLKLIKDDQMFQCYFDEANHDIVHFEVLSGKFVHYPRWKEVLLAWRGILIVAAILCLITGILAVTLKMMIWIFTLCFLFYLVILFAFGASHIIEGALIVFIIAFLTGMLERAHFQTSRRIEEIEQQKITLQPATNGDQRIDSHK